MIHDRNACDEFNRLWASATPPLPFEAPTFSAGAAAIPADADTAENLLNAADQRLYNSKRSGRNRLTIV